MGLQETKAKLEALIKDEGMSNVHFAYKAIRLKKVREDRDPRKAFTWAQLKRQAQKQRWCCGICGGPMSPVRGTIVMDHKDPNRLDFNHPDNLQAVHDDPCNREKGAKSIPQQSKDTGKPFNQLI